MSDLQRPSYLRDFPAALVKNRWVQLFAAVLTLLELYNHGAIPAYVTTQKGIETAAIAEITALRQRAEAEIQEWKAITETQIATNAARKQKADARKASADARVAEAEEIIARETAKVSAIKAKAQAEAVAGDADIKEQQAVVERERAAQAQRLNQASARYKEYEAAEERLGTMIDKETTGNPGGTAHDAFDAGYRRIFGR
jgi:hypothetical protein